MYIYIKPTKRCSCCGRYYAFDSKQCPHCEQQPETASPVSERHKWTSAKVKNVLLIVFGCIAVLSVVSLISTSKGESKRENTETQRSVQNTTDAPEYGRDQNSKQTDVYEYEPNIGDYSDTPGDYPFASERLLDYEELAHYSLQELRIMRNEIFARHGYIFRQGGEMEKHFSKQPWYSPRYKDVNSMLSDIEIANIAKIKTIEGSN